MVYNFETAAAGMRHEDYIIGEVELFGRVRPVGSRQLIIGGTIDRDWRNSSIISKWVQSMHLDIIPDGFRCVCWHSDGTSSSRHVVLSEAEYVLWESFLVWVKGQLALHGFAMVEHTIEMSGARLSGGPAPDDYTWQPLTLPTDRGSIYVSYSGGSTGSWGILLWPLFQAWSQEHISLLRQPE
jgi:hypothetical protein